MQQNESIFADTVIWVQNNIFMDKWRKLRQRNDSSIEINTQFKCYDNKKYNC